MENLRTKFAEGNLRKALRRNNLTDWEKEFLSSIEDQVKKNKELSHDQYNKLFEIADEKKKR